MSTQWWKDGDHADVGLFRHPPVDPTTGEVSASDDAILLGQVRHCDTPQPFRRESCEYVMHDHGWMDFGDSGRTVCPGDYVETVGA